MRKKGFTLIELLVVIAIIGILATIVMVAVGGARAQARAAKAVGDMNQLMMALELCYSAGCPDVLATAEPVLCDTDTYLEKQPSAPSGYTYTNTGTSSDYTLTATGFGDGGTFTCKGGSCYCTPDVAGEDDCKK